MVFANGAERVGYRYYATGPYGTNAEPYDGRPASIQDGFNFQGDKNGSKWSTLVREIPRALATGKLDLRPAVSGGEDHPRRVRQRSMPSSISTRTAICTDRPRKSSVWPATRSSRRDYC